MELGSGRCADARVVAAATAALHVQRQLDGYISDDVDGKLSIVAQAEKLFAEQRGLFSSQERLIQR